MLPFYIISLSIASGIVGSFVRHVFTQFGYIPAFLSGLYVTIGAAFLFAAAQVAYLTVLRLYQPSRAPTVYITEGISLLTILFLFPAILDFSFPGLPESYARHAPLLYVGVTGAFHLSFKFMSFYAALRGTPDAGRPILIWAGLSVLFALIGFFGFNEWKNRVDAARLTVTSPVVTVANGHQYAHARAMQEGAALEGTMQPRELPTMSLRFANLEPDLRQTEPLSRVYVTVNIEGRDVKTFQSSAALHDDRWAEIVVPSSYFPRDPTHYTVYWTQKEEPNWQRILGLRPIVYNLPKEPGAPPPPPAALYISGPSVYVERDAPAGLSLLIVVVDGLAVDHLSLFGYSREVSPAIDRLGVRGHLFPKTLSPGSDTAIGLSSLMTGQDPTALTGGSTSTPLATALSPAGFASAAFVETGPGEQYFDAAWAQDFDVFDERPYPNPELGAADDSGGTLGRAREWISDHRGVPFLCLVRVRSVAQVPPSDAAIDEAFENGDTAPRDVDRYDSALLRLDRQLGALFKYIRDYETRSNTCIVLTSTYGIQFSPGAEKRVMDARTESVPLIIETPDRRQVKHPQEAALHDLAPTMAGLADVRLPALQGAVNLLN